MHSNSTYCQKHLHTSPGNQCFLILFQAFIFWVVDNFLKRKIKGTKTIYVSDVDTSVKYSKNKEEARCYNRIEKSEDFFESDIMASTDDEPDLRFRATDGTEKLLA